jgi:transcriptional regulator of acetoin/glycerol metabolism
LFGSSLPKQAKCEQAQSSAPVVNKYATDRLIIPLQEIEKAAILKAIDLCSKDVKAAASRLGIGTSTLYRKLKNYGSGY